MVNNSNDLIEESGYDILLKGKIIETELDFMLLVFGDELARREDYKELKGLDAIRYYLIEKYHWTISYVNTLALSDIRFLLSEEMHGWRLPSDARLSLRKLEKAD